MHGQSPSCNIEESVPNLVLPFTNELGEKGVIRAISG